MNLSSPALLPGEPVEMRRDTAQNFAADGICVGAGTIFRIPIGRELFAETM